MVLMNIAGSIATRPCTLNNSLKMQSILRFHCNCRIGRRAVRAGPSPRWLRMRPRGQHD